MGPLDPEAGCRDEAQWKLREGVMGDQLRHVIEVLRVAGVTVADIAERSGCSLQDVSAELAGRRPMSLHTSEAIGSLAGVTLAVEVQAMTGRARAEYLEEANAGRL